MNIARHRQAGQGPRPSRTFLAALSVRVLLLPSLPQFPLLQERKPTVLFFPFIQENNGLLTQPPLTPIPPFDRHQPSPPPLTDCLLKS
ncbi:hypothetical protein GUJ93_ZPchr0013g34335 [Zizania palustris]|uniref:Uncharacterized protein n=1 Tax=Zizania palustris TaxID=103762 RepID=A0A8J5WZB4_ZIZPA|nr:hypothetical protein GUJ93_ZPchr0013g34335 [Zizania palustris]